jgi:hypothetical protein
LHAVDANSGNAANVGIGLSSPPSASQQPDSGTVLIEAAAASNFGTPSSTRNTQQQRTPIQGWATDFEVPWGRMEDRFLRACYENKRPEKPALLAAVRVVAGDIKQITNHPSKSDLHVIARAMIAKYPKILADFLPDIGMLGDGTTSLTNRLIRIFLNCNRSCSNSLRRHLLNHLDDSADENVGGKTKKKIAPSKHTRDAYGCVAWQPDLPSGETVESQNEKKTWLISEFTKNPHERDGHKIKLYMEATYASQRFFLTEETNHRLLF